MADETRSYWDLLEPHWNQLGNYSTAEDFSAIATQFPRPIVLLYAAHFCQSEVWNGGLLQLFLNSTGVMAPEAVEGYKVLGMHLLAEVLRTAMTHLGPAYPREREERSDALIKASPMSDEEVHTIFETSKNFFIAYRDVTMPLGFDALDEQFWKLAKVENGGFKAAADTYALSIEPTLVWPNPTPEE